MRSPSCVQRFCVGALCYAFLWFVVLAPTVMADDPARIQRADGKAHTQVDPRNSRGKAPIGYTKAAERVPKTPFQRVVMPGLKRLKALKNLERRRSLSIHPGIPALNFGGFVAAPKFQAFDVADGDLSGLLVIATGDFNKDGKPDVVTIQPTGTINVILNQSPGGNSGTGVAFSAPITTEPGFINLAGARQAIAADVDGDGFDDLVVLDSFNNCLEVLLGFGDGTFAPPTQVALGNVNAVNAFAAADVNGDGHPDILLLSSTVSFDNNFNATTTLEFDTYLNDGTGNFLVPGASLTQVLTYSDYYQGLTGRSIVLTDVNGDGKPDATVELVHWLTTDSPDEEHVVLTMLGNGTGAFQTPDPNATLIIPAESTFNIGYPLVANLNVVDVNNDSFKDIIFSYQDYSIYEALGNGDGTYQYPTNVGANGNYPTDLWVADLNGDGAPDLVDAEPDYLAIYPAHGDGTFDLPTIHNYGSGMGTLAVLAVADFNGDGLPDPAIMNGYEETVTVFPSVAGSAPMLHAGQLLASGDDVITRIQAQAVLDANGDGFDDIFFYSRGADRNNPSLVTALGDGKGNFSNKNGVPGYVANTFDFTESATGDFNGDGRPDIVLHTFTGMTLLLSNGDGSFTPSPISLAQNFNCSTHYAAIGDVNGDGKLDLVVAYEGDSIYGCNSGSTPSGFYTLLGKGDGTFQTAVFTPIGMEVFQPVLVDLNGDGVLDLEISDDPFDIIGGIFNSYVLLGNGDGTFGAPTTIIPNYINASTLTADLNGDGHQDLVVLTQGLTDPVSGTYQPGLAGAMVMFGDGAGNVSPGPVFAQAFFSPGGVLTDVNGDGKPDLVLSEYTSVDFGSGLGLAGGIVGLGNGDGSFTAVGNYEVGDASTVVLTGNFLKDNATDAAFVSGGTGTTLLIAQGGTSEVLQAGANPILLGNTAQFSVSLAPTLSGRPVPSGTVTLMEGTTPLATGTLDGGATAIAVDGLGLGSHTITAVYSGDSNFNVNSQAQTSIAVLPLPAITVSSSPESLSLKQGQSGLLTLTLSANAAFNGTVALTAAGAPGAMGVELNPSSVALQAGQSSVATVAISTVQPANAQVASRQGSSAGLRLILACVSLGLLVTIPARGRKSLRMFALFGVMALSLVSLAALTACGGGSSNSNNGGGGGNNNVLLVPKGTYTITITVQPSDPNTAAQTIPVQITVD